MIASLHLMNDSKSIDTSILLGDRLFGHKEEVRQSCIHYIDCGLRWDSHVER